MQHAPSKDMRPKDAAIHDKLARLKQLKAEGLITEADFVKKEQGLLAQLPKKKPAENDIAAKLERLKQLKDEGLISEADFAKKKSDLLAQM